MPTASGARRRRWEHRRIEVAPFDETDPNNIREYRLAFDAHKRKLAQDVRRLAERLDRGWDRSLRLGVLMTGAHAYKPLLWARNDSEVEARPVALNSTERQVVEKLAELAATNTPGLGGRDLYLVRNMTGGRGLSFFDDFAYYPDFILWLKAGARQHMLFLDPKGLSRYGPKERDKVRLHKRIGEVEAQVRESDPDLRLGSYVLSVTPPAEIGAAPRPQAEWESDGVYFLEDPDCFRKVVADALGAP